MPSSSDRKKKRPGLEALTSELESLVLHEIALEYERVNRAYFKGALRTPTFDLGDGAHFGRFFETTRTLEISRKLVETAGWGAVVEVLKHEMAHQYIVEALRVEGETSHGPAFRSICERLGIDARASGLPEVQRPPEEERILERVAKLLALAESPSEHEAQTAMNVAQRLMLKYNLENVSVRGARAYSFRHLGKPTGRVTEAERMIAVILGDHFFVNVIWVPVYRALEDKRGSVLEVCGTRANLDLAAYVYDFLRGAGERLWREHQARIGTKKNRDRLPFLAGVMSGFYAKLNDERKAQSKEGLVWVGDADLRAYYRRRHPHIQSARFSGSARNEAHAQGREAGRRLVLHRPMGQGPSGRTHLLTKG